MHDNAGALGGECSADGLTYATSTAGDEHHLTIQPGFHAGREMFRYFMFSDYLPMKRMRVAITRGVSPAIGTCELTFLEREAIDVENARTQHSLYEGLLGHHEHEVAEDELLNEGLGVEPRGKYCFPEGLGV